MEVSSIEELKQKLDLPKTLYKIRPFNTRNANDHWGAFLNCEIYLPQAKTFNDPFDCYLPLIYEDFNQEKKEKKLKELLGSRPRYATETQNTNYIKDFLKYEPLIDSENFAQSTKWAHEDINKLFGILCLALNIESTVMWSYYGNSHTGFAIGYNSDKLLDTEFFNMGGRIDYIDDMPLVDMEEKRPGYFFKSQLFTKSIDWKHEDEYRFIHKVNNGKRILKLNYDVIDELVFGASVSEHNIIEYTKKATSMFPHIKICQMKKNTTSFGMYKHVTIDPLKVSILGD